ncbi:hypothetical protein BJX96DRAFT_143521 [Aspergillus floccosus]
MALTLNSIVVVLNHHVVRKNRRDLYRVYVFGRCLMVHGWRIHIIPVLGLQKDLNRVKKP